MSTPVAKAKMAIVYSHEADMGLRIEQYVNGLRYYTDWTYRFYLPFHDAGLHRDVIAPGQNYDDYKVIFAPLWPYISDDQRSRLKNWVAQGGTLILGPMSGYRTNEWAFFTDYALGDLEEWSGIEVDSRIPIGLSRRSEEIPLFLQWNIDSMEKAEASLWSDALSGKGKILASYENGMHNGKAAIMENNYKKGKLVVLGTDPGRAAITKLLLHYAEQHEIKPTYTGDKNVLVVPRENQKQRGTIVVNHSNEVKNISIEKVGVDLLNGEKTSQKLNLNPYEVKVIRH
ncbi:MAG: beta-galactosidase trimerization domain-containing protein, partial [Cyclobacteriaceae bacterium]